KTFKGWNGVGSPGSCPGSLNAKNDVPPSRAFVKILLKLFISWRTITLHGGATNYLDVLNESVSFGQHCAINVQATSSRIANVNIATCIEGKAVRLGNDPAKSRILS